MNEYVPLRIHARFRSSVSVDRYCTLDGILGALIIRDPVLRQESNRRRTFRRVSSEHGYQRAVEYFAAQGWETPRYSHFLPLAVWGHGIISGVWVYCSSVAIPDEPWEFDTVQWTRRVDVTNALDWVSDPPRRVETGKGEFKSYYMPVPVLVTSGLTWYARGIKGEIERILQTAVGIGKKRSQGLGSVMEWTVEDEADDKSVWDGDALMRPVPRELLEKMGIRGEFEYGYYAFKPPYHDARNFAECAMRGRRTQIAGEIDASGNLRAADTRAAALSAFGCA